MNSTGFFQVYENQYRFSTNGVLLIVNGNGHFPPNEHCHPSGKTLKTSPDYGICETVKWSSTGKTAAGGNGPGDSLNQLNNPFELLIDPNNDDTVIIVDHENGRIMRWAQGEISRQIIAGGNGIGNRSDQLTLPRYIAVDNEGTLFITEYTNKRVSRWEKGASSGDIIISNINANGIALEPEPDEKQSLFVGDWFSAYILKFNKNGTGRRQIVVGSNGSRSSLKQLSTRRHLNRR
ncbi:unnamed protein product [Rotaria magnacalcarata]|uniref:Uncharacterized protein n=1 Tax=Rotaria magnacalcarata TaxID=392030 RepID=A0A819B7Q9_9BILA|nr:unnamed protein product [Rotaria magnacalcarata]CAF3846591.1 unnamed protein product [Rotaria magnacalcarata]